MKTFIKGEIAKSEIAKTGVMPVMGTGTWASLCYATESQSPRLPGQTGRAKSGKVKRKTAELRSGAVVIENFKNLLQVKKPVFEN